MISRLRGIGSVDQSGEAAKDLKAVLGEAAGALERSDAGAAVDLSGAVVLTHLRTDIIAAGENLSLSDEPAEPLVGHTGEGRGTQAEIPLSLLSALIAALNDKFGAGLGEADRIWFAQQEENLHADDDVRTVALDNDLSQFSVFLTPLIEKKIVERHQDNGELVGAFFGNPDYRELVEEFLIKSLWERIRREGKAG